MRWTHTKMRSPRRSVGACSKHSNRSYGNALCSSIHVRLRALEISDLPYLYQWENDATAWSDSETHNPLSQTLLRDYIEQSTGDIYKDGQLRLIIEDGSTIGCIDLFDFDPRSRKAAIGMYIAPAARGKGYGKQAVALLEDYAFGFLGLHMLYAIIAADNQPCLAIYRQAHYEESALLRQWVRKNDGTYQDTIVFQKINKEA